jgi:hypothetical protein
VTDKVSFATLAVWKVERFIQSTSTIDHDGLHQLRQAQGSPLIIRIALLMVVKTMVY